MLLRAVGKLLSIEYNGRLWGTPRQRLRALVFSILQPLVAQGTWKALGIPLGLYFSVREVPQGNVKGFSLAVHLAICNAIGKFLATNSMFMGMWYTTRQC